MRDEHEKSVFSEVPLSIFTLEPNGSRGKPGRCIRLSGGRTCTQQIRELPGVMKSAQGIGPTGKHFREHARSISKPASGKSRKMMKGL